MPVDSIEVAFRQTTEDPHGDSGDDKTTAYGLQKYCVLNLTESRFLDPDFAIENFS